MLKSKQKGDVREEVKAISEALAKQTAKSDKKTVSVRLNPDTHRRIMVARANTGESASDLIEKAINKYLETIK
jgi:predicted HicB family RNase H-like nuclease